MNSSVYNGPSSVGRFLVDLASCVRFLPNAFEEPAEDLLGALCLRENEPLEGAFDICLSMRGNFRGRGDLRELKSEELGPAEEDAALLYESRSRA